MQGKLTVIPTPIGNLEDITYRAVRLLREVELVLAEDTRTSKKLLQHYEISTPLRPFHQHNEHREAERIVDDFKAGKHYALISDAGMPGISDPGFLLIRHCLDAEVPVEVLPGATAFVPALLKSGLAAHIFTFEGFLPHKKGRQKRLGQLADEERTMIFYESPYRLLKLLGELQEHFGPERQASVSRELTKKFEETVNGSIEELHGHFTESPPKGEFVVVVAGKA